jgi:hypothetical protein
MTTTKQVTHLREQRDTAVEQSSKQAHEYTALKVERDELLAALNAIMDENGRHYFIDGPIAEMARAAIAKANGQGAVCTGCYRDPCVCLPDNCNCDPE